MPVAFAKDGWLVFFFVTSELSNPFGQKEQDRTSCVLPGRFADYCLHKKSA
jgi:hypothetical protein